MTMVLQPLEAFVRPSRAIAGLAAAVCLLATSFSVHADGARNSGSETRGTTRDGASMLFPIPVPPESPTTDRTAWARSSSRRTAETDSSSTGDHRLELPPPPHEIDVPPASDEFHTDESPLDAERRRMEKELRYRELQDRLRRMISLWREQQLAGSTASNSQTDNSQADDENQPDADTPSADNSRTTNDSSTDIADEQPSAEDPESATDSADDAESADGDAMTESADDAPDVGAKHKMLQNQLAGSAVVDGPVDRIGLADNLYGMGEIVIALQMYEEVDTSTISESEKLWITFQTASCLRRLNRIPEAQERYRRLAGEKEAGWLAARARWWLDHIDARSDLENQIARYQKIIDALKEPKNGSNGK
ncbi:MAG: hypothetical protein R3C19_20755 [Planctomycetaceae bacterium]